MFRIVVRTHFKFIFTLRHCKLCKNIANNVKKFTNIAESFRFVSRHPLR